MIRRLSSHLFQINLISFLSHVFVETRAGFQTRRTHRREQSPRQGPLDAVADPGSPSSAAEVQQTPVLFTVQPQVQPLTEFQDKTFRYRRPSSTVHPPPSAVHRNPGLLGTPDPQGQRSPQEFARRLASRPPSRPRATTVLRAVFADPLSRQAPARPARAAGQSRLSPRQTASSLRTTDRPDAVRTRA